MMQCAIVVLHTLSCICLARRARPNNLNTRYKSPVVSRFWSGQLLVYMAHSRLPFVSRLSLLFLLTHVAPSWAAPTPEQAFTLFGLPITLHNGGDGGSGGKKALTRPIRTQTTTLPRTPDFTTIPARTTSPATTNTSTLIVAAATAPSQKAHTNGAASSDGKSETTSPASTATPSPLLYLPTDILEPVTVSSTIIFEAAASSPPSVALPSTSNKAALAANIFIPLAVLLLLLAAGVVYKRRRIQAKKQAALNASVVPYMREISDFGAVPPSSQLAIPQRSLDIDSAPSMRSPSTVPTIRDSILRAEGWDLGLVYLTTDDGHSFISEASYEQADRGRRVQAKALASASSAPAGHDAPDSPVAADPRNSSLLPYTHDSAASEWTGYDVPSSPGVAESKKPILVLSSPRYSHLLAPDRYSTPPPPSSAMSIIPDSFRPVVEINNE
ncbi:hypothetical protein K438DRAFT_2007736 [Mycena galopus ATCC 62051]|nr:hypothetical protein K438DRAFT_2007736 [Mycena galopus ATCC 62051]